MARGEAGLAAVGRRGRGSGDSQQKLAGVGRLSARCELQKDGGLVGREGPDDSGACRPAAPLRGRRHECSMLHDGMLLLTFTQSHPMLGCRPRPLLAILNIPKHTLHSGNMAGSRNTTTAARETRPQLPSFRHTSVQRSRAWGQSENPKPREHIAPRSEQAWAGGRRAMEENFRPDRNLHHIFNVITSQAKGGAGHARRRGGLVTGRERGE